MSERFLADEHPVVLLRPHLTFPYAWAGHIPFAYLAVDLLRPRLLVELGSDSGNSYLAFCQAIAELGCDTRSVAIDCWEGDEHARHYGTEVYETLRAYHYPRYGGFSRLMRSYFDDAVNAFEDSSIDLLHIDGLHSYEAVSHDFETWLPKLSDRAVVLLHDTEVHERGFGVSQFLEQLAGRYRTFNFLHSNGLGVVAVGRNLPPAFAQFLDHAQASPDTVRHYFEGLARTIVQPDGTMPVGAEVAPVELVSSLYYRKEDESFSDQRVATRRMSGEEGKTLLRFELVEGARPDYIRFDPAEVPGVFEIYRIALGTSLGDLVSLEHLSARLGHVSGDLLPGGEGGIAIVGSDTDPYFEVAVADMVRPLPANGALIVEVAVRIVVALRDPRLWKLAGAQLSALGPLREIARHQVDVRTLSRQIQQMLDSQHRASAENARQLDELRVALSLASGKLEAFREREKDLQRQLEQMRASDTQSKVEAEAAIEREMDLHRRHLELTAVTFELQAHSNVMHEARKQLAGELDSLRSSTSWRLMAPLRSVSGFLSPTARRSARRAVKALWWLVTPWQLPARLRFLRQQRSNGGGLVVAPRQVGKRPPFRVQAIHGLVPIGEPRRGQVHWRARGNDPHFHLLSGTGALRRLRGGWYILSIAIEAKVGTLDSPKLYVDYGLGFSEANAIGLKRMLSSAGIVGLVRFDRDVIGLRFDPAVGECDFVLGDINLSRVSRGQAALSMYKALVKREGSRLPVRSSVAARYRLGGARAVGDWLYENYAAEAQAGPDYGQWVQRFDTLSPRQIRNLTLRAKQLALHPTISLVMPVYNTEENWLRRCLDSVLQQVYPWWELCIADDASTAPHVREVLQQYAAKDERIKVVYREHNGHISTASNSALALASGEWIALIDHDDELPIHALYMVAKTIHDHPNARVIYSDEDKINAEGDRFDPYFKPDWNPDLFLSQNMLSHFGVYHAEVVRQVGGFREGYEGSQDYDLALRCVEKLQGDQIVHIPYVLYHWRAIAGSTALAKDEKGYAAIAGARALRDHLSRTGTTGATVHITSHGYRVQRALPDGAEPTVTLIIPTRDRVELLRMCVNSILEKTSYLNYEIAIVDNQSVEPETIAFFKQLEGSPRVRVLGFDAPFNFSRMNNMAAASCHSDLIGLINNDIEVISPDWLTEMVSQAIRPEAGVVGAMLYYPNDTVQHAGVVIGLGGIANHAYVGQPRGAIGQMGRAGLLQDFSAVTAACMLVRRDVYNAVGGLDDRLQVAFNDVDFCLRVREAGYRVLWTPYAELYHHESASRGAEDTPEKRARFAGEVELMNQRWSTQLLADPAYNPNLTLVATDFAIADEPRVRRLACFAEEG